MRRLDEWKIWNIVLNAMFGMTDIRYMSRHDVMMFVPMYHVVSKTVENVAPSVVDCGRRLWPWT